MIWEKIKKIFILSFLLAGCTNPKAVASPKYDLSAAVDSTLNSNNYKLIIYDEFNADKEKIFTNFEYKVDGEVIYLNQTNSENSDFSGYYYEGKAYFETYGQKVLMDDSISMNDIISRFLNIDETEVQYSEADGNSLASYHFDEETKNKYIDEFIADVGMDKSQIKSSDYKATILYNEKIIEINHIYNFVMNSGNYKQYSFNSSAKFSDYEKVHVSMPDDLAAYVPSENINDNLGVKELLIGNLGYVEENNTLVLDFNENETYIFDINNKLFTYKLLSTYSTYNYLTNIGTYNQCTYDFNESKSVGICSEEDIERISETKIYLGIELESINKTINDIK